MSAAATVLSFRYRAPRPCCAVNPQADKPLREAQAALDRGLHAAESEMRAAGYDSTTAQHLVRMAALMVLTPLHGSTLPAGVVFDGLVDRINREGWLRR
jgi:hypothetical protein